MEWKQAKGNIRYWEGGQLIPIYQTAAMRRELEMNDRHLVCTFYPERYLCPYLDDLVDAGRPSPMNGTGVPRVGASQ